MSGPSMPMADARRARGSGGLYQRASDGMWVAAISLPTPMAHAGARSSRGRRRPTRSRSCARLRQELERIGDLRTSSPTLRPGSTCGGSATP
jgi:hypothetical protein